jgi:hypothetical protein
MSPCRGWVGEAQSLDGLSSSCLWPAVAPSGHDHRGVTHEALDQGDVGAGLEQLGGEGPPGIVG